MLSLGCLQSVFHIVFITGNPGMNCDEIARPIFNGAMGMVKQLGFTPSHLYLEVGILNKRIKER